MTGKTLRSMPDEVRYSSLALSSHWAARLLRWVEFKADLVYGFALYCAWWVPLYCLAVATLDFEWLQVGYPYMRKFIFLSYLAMFVCALSLHWLKLFMCVPRADRSYPLINNTSIAMEDMVNLAAHMGLYSALLWAGLLLGMPAGQSAGNLPFAVAMTLAAAIAFLAYRRPPKFGYNVPSDADVEAGIVAREQRTAGNAGQPGRATEEDYVVPVKVRQPKRDFESIFGMRAVKEKLLEPARKIVAERTEGASPADNGILLHGEPGDGKTVFAEALAGELQVPLVELTYGDIASKWLGEMPRLIVKSFAYARAHAPCVLFIDEFDSFVASRDGGSNNSEDLKITNTLLTELVKIRDAGVVVMAATNFVDRLDAAAIREGRFDYKVEIGRPDDEARLGLLKQAASRVSDFTVDESALQTVAKRWAGFSVSRLLAIGKALPVVMRNSGTATIGFDQWGQALREVQGRAKKQSSAKSLDQMILPQETRGALELISRRLTDVHRIESLGGTLPGGVLFLGPPGTGKTEAARSIAKASGWEFLSVTGPDISADRGLLKKTYAKACDLRPAIIFIDEADAVLQNRQYSATPDLTNTLLVLMDGTEQRIPDVVFVAATNHADQIDPALLRSGRFTEKVEFTAPPQAEIPKYIAQWLKGKNVVLEPGLDVFDVAADLEGHTVANVNGVLQYAVNRAIDSHRDGAHVLIRREDIRAGRRVVLAEDAAE